MWNRRRGGRGLAALILLFVLAAPAGVGATPETIVLATITPMCTGGDRVVLWLDTLSNRGYHTTRDQRWTLVMVDLAELTAETRDHGGVALDYYPFFDGGSEPIVRYRDGDAPPIGRSLAEWGVQRCFQQLRDLHIPTQNGVWPAPRLEKSFAYRVTAEGVEVSLGGRSRIVEDPVTYDVRRAVPDMWPTYSAEEAHLATVHLGFQFDDTPLQPPSLITEYAFFLDTKHVLVVSGYEELESFDVLVVTSAAAMRRAHDELLEGWLRDREASDSASRGEPAQPEIVEEVPL